MSHQPSTNPSKIGGLGGYIAAIIFFAGIIYFCWDNGPVKEAEKTDSPLPTISFAVDGEVMKTKENLPTKIPTEIGIPVTLSTYPNQEFTILPTTSIEVDNGIVKDTIEEKKPLSLGNISANRNVKITRLQDGEVIILFNFKKI